jgi:NDP-sugar pyrophosphorylase family protein
MVLHGDLVLEETGVQELLQVFKKSKSSIVYYHLRNRTESRSEIVTEENMVVEFLEFPSSNKNLEDSIHTEKVKVNSGIYIFLPNIYKNLGPPKLGSDIPEFLLTSLAEKRQLYALEWRFKRLSVDSHDTLLEAQSYLKDKTL